MIKTFPAWLRIPAIVFILYCAVFSYSHLLGVDIMEARNYVTAREMTEGSNWLVPTMNGELRIAKPPLPTWLTAIAMKLAGSDTNLIVNRIPAGLAALLLLLLFYRFTLSYTGCHKISAVSTLFLSTSYMFMFMSRRGTWDMISHTFMMASIWALYKATGSNGTRTPYFVATGVFMGLSFLSKGPVSPYALLLPFLLSEFISGDVKKYLAHWKMLAFSLLIAALISIAWPVYLSVSVPEKLAAVASTEIDAWGDRHVKSIFWYLQFPVMSGIWLFFALPALWAPHSSKISGENFPTRKLMFWIILTVILLSLIPEKKDRYLLPITIPMALLIGGYVTGLINSVRNTGAPLATRYILKFHSLLFVALLTAAAAAGLYDSVKHATGMYNVAILLAVIAMLFSFARILLKGQTPDPIYFILAFALLTQTGASVLSRDRKPDNYMEILKIRNNARLSAQKFYTDYPDMKVVWAIGKKMYPWNVTVLNGIKDGEKIAYLTRNGSEAVIPELDSNKYEAVPDEELEFENWQLYQISRILPATPED